MERKSYYFPHDSNAHADPKCSALIKDHGMAGYGIYWMVVEVLHEQGGSLDKFPKLLSGLSYQLMIEEETLSKIINALISDYKLLKEDDKCIWSDRVRRNIQGIKDKYEAKARAGHIGGVRSGEARRLKQGEATLEANEQKESKEKKNKEDEKVTATFLTELKSNPAYKGIDIDRELGKMDAWLKAHKDRQFTQAFVIGWLNKIDVPVNAQPERKWL